MRLNDFRKSISTAFQRFQELNLADWSNFPNKNNLKTNSEFNKIALNPSSRYVDIYKDGLGSSHYNFLLSDHSYFQFSMEARGDKLRYAYYSNPFEIKKSFEDYCADLSKQGESGNFYELYMQELDESELLFLIPPIRYDFDPNNYIPKKHPAGHFHIGIFQGGRVAARRKLTPLNFSLFIAKYYYSHYWDRYYNKDVKTGNYVNPFDEYLVRSKKSSRVLDSSLFSKYDEDLPYID